MDKVWDEDDYVRKLLQFLPDETARASVMAHRSEVARLFREAYADGVENGMLAAQAADPLL